MEGSEQLLTFHASSHAPRSTLVFKVGYVYFHMSMLLMFLLVMTIVRMITAYLRVPVCQDIYLFKEGLNLVLRQP